MGEILRDDKETGITMLVMIILGIIFGALGYRMYHYYDCHINDNDYLRHDDIGFDSDFIEEKFFEIEKNLNPPQPQNIYTYAPDPTL